jgi:hypothetical protein
MENAARLRAFFHLSFLCSFNNHDFLFRQIIQLIDQLVNLFVRRGDLPLNGGLGGRGLGSKVVAVSVLPPWRTAKMPRPPPEPRTKIS